MRTKHWFVLGVLVIFLIPVSMMAQYGPHHEMKMEKLNLTEQQEDQLEEYATAHHKEMIKLHADLKIVRIELNEALTEGASEKEVGKKVDAVNAAHAAVLKAKTNHQLQVRNVLGADKFEMWMSKRGHRFGGKCGMMGPGKGHGMRHGKGMGDGPHRRWED